MSALRQAVEDYITLRRALGSKLERHPRLLESFAGYLEAAGATTITIELALSRARLPGDDANPAYLSNRRCAVRGFARHLQAFDPATEVPPARLLPWPKCRAAPYIYSEDDIAALMRAARLLTPVLRAALLVWENRRCDPRSPCALCRRTGRGRRLGAPPHSCARASGLWATGRRRKPRLPTCGTRWKRCSPRSALRMS